MKIRSDRNIGFTLEATSALKESKLFFFIFLRIRSHIKKGLKDTKQVRKKIHLNLKCFPRGMFMVFKESLPFSVTYYSNFPFPSVLNRIVFPHLVVAVSSLKAHPHESSQQSLLLVLNLISKL